MTPAISGRMCTARQALILLLASPILCQLGSALAWGGEAEAPRGFGVEPPGGEFGTWAALTRDPPLGFVSVDVATMMETPDAPAFVRLGPFDEKRYGLRSASIRLLREPRLSDGGASLELELLVDGDGRQQGWRVASHETRFIEEDFLIDVRPGREDFIGSAAPDPGVPLVLVRYGSSGLGANAVWAAQTDLLIDLRGRRPRVRARLQRILNEGGGACTVWGNQHHETCACTWDAARLDFLCRYDDLHSSATWARRSTRRSFVLANESAWPPGVVPLPPESVWRASLHELKKPLAARSTLWLDGVGPTLPLLEIPQAGRAVVATAGGCGGRLDARFFVLRPGADIAAEIEAPWLDELLAPEASRYRWEGPCTSKLGEPLAREDTPTRFLTPADARSESELWRLVIEETGRRTVYLLAVGAHGGEPTVGAVAMATDANTQTECGRLEVPGSAMQANAAGPLRWDFLVQPGFVAGHVASEFPAPSFDVYSEDPIPRGRCLEHVRLSWGTDEGFVVDTHTPIPCTHPLPPLWPTIGSDFSASPAGHGELPTRLRGPATFGVRGSGRRTVVFLHDAGLNRHVWADVVGRLVQRLPGMLFLNVDLPSHGESQYEWIDPESWEIADVGAVVGDLLETLSIRRAVLVGHGVGAVVARAAAEAPPAWLEAVVIAGGEQEAGDIGDRVALAEGTPAERLEWLRYLGVDPTTDPARRFSLVRSHGGATKRLLQLARSWQPTTPGSGVPVLGLPAASGSEALPMLVAPGATATALAGLLSSIWESSR